MKYQQQPRRRASEYEKALADWWQKTGAFEQSIAQRPESDAYVFYDGPPFITGNPHHGTLLSSIVKDAVPRFWTMRGKQVERRWGWDCHGLPAENYVEKQLGITDRREIGTKWSLEEYITKARESMVANSQTWEGTINRIGRWVDFKGAYRTMDKEFMESVWWAFKTLYDQGKIYEGRKVLMYDTKFATPVSKAEVTMDNDAYQTVTDPSAYVKFQSDKGYLLAWTTTPWTLPANLALAVNAELEYGVYQVGGERLILATQLAEQALGEDFSQPLETFPGSQLVGVAYQPLIETVPAAERQPDTYTVLAADFVSSEEGTGIVHIAPAYGEDDYQLMLSHQLDFVDVLDDNGYYLPAVAEQLRALGVRDTDEAGIECWAGNKFIAKVLEVAGTVYRIAYIKHDYPFNPRSKQRIMYRAFPSWFFDVAGAKSLMLEQNKQINWFPAYLKHGRFAKNIEQAPDWNLSRDRFWATAMPVWKGDQGAVKVVGSYDELYRLSGKRLEDYHRPWVDQIEFDAWVDAEGQVSPVQAGVEPPAGSHAEHFTRIEKVLDCWFESGSMPFAQLHYPFENKEKFEAGYPADFVVEYVGQVRAWFYYLHCVNTALFGANAFKNVIVTGTLAGNDGRKMSKSLGNFTDPNELMDKYSADSLRFLLLSSPVLAGEDFALIDKDVSDVARKLTMIWNVYDFFIMYASVDNFDSDAAELPGKHGPVRVNDAGLPADIGAQLELDVSAWTSPLDLWIISRLHQLRNEITTAMEEYNLPQALSGVLPFVDDLSNWFVRRSRRRFWKSEDDGDKQEAYATLYYVMTYLSKILAPFVPFLAEELYQNLTASGQSVHLLDWPAAGGVATNVLEQMAAARQAISDGLALRMQKSDAEAQIKVRQPLKLFTYAGPQLPAWYEQTIAEEVNVKKVVHGDTAQLDKNITPELAAEGFARELIRVVQSARKKAGLNVDDRIKLSVSVDLAPAWRQQVAEEVLATEFNNDGNYAYDEIAKIDGQQVTISLEKA